MEERGSLMDVPTAELGRGRAYYTAILQLRFCWLMSVSPLITKHEGQREEQKLHKGNNSSWFTIYFAPFPLLLLLFLHLIFAFTLPYSVMEGDFLPNYGNGGGGGGVAWSNSRLAEMCIEAACASKESVEVWRRQKRTLERLPSHLAQLLLHRLLRGRLLSAPLLESFRHSVQEVDASCEAALNREWMAYLGEFRYLRVLRVADCRAVSDAALSHLTGLDLLEELDVARCPKVTDDGARYLLFLTNLQKLRLSETGVGAGGLSHLSVLTSLRFLDLGGLPLTDGTLSSLRTLNQLRHLDAWGSAISDEGALLTQGFPHLESLNLAWTSVTRIPCLPSLSYMNMSQCTVVSIFEGWDSAEAPLRELHLSGANILDPYRVFAGLGTKNVSVLDLSSSKLDNHGVLVGLKRLESLDLSGTILPELAMLSIVQIGEKLTRLDLSGSKVGSKGVESLSGFVPKLEQLSLSGTLVDDSVLPVLGLMPSLRGIDLSHTAVKGYSMMVEAHIAKAFSFGAIEHLQDLRVLNLESTFVSDKSCRRLVYLTQVSHLYLRGDLLSDASLQSLSLMSNLIILGVQGAVLTDSGLLSFKPPPLLQELDLTDCWLLSEEGVLKFCKTNSHVLLRHELMPDEQLSSYNLLNKDSKTRNGVLIFEGNKFKKDLNTLKMSKLDYNYSLEQWISDESSKRRYGRKHDRDMEKRAPMVIDERLKYSLPYLLHLRVSPLSNENVTALDLTRIPDALLTRQR